MNGITIINTTDIYKYVGFATYSMLFCAIGIFVLILTIFMIISESNRAAITTFVTGILLCVVGLCMGLYRDNHANTFDYTEYDILIDDSISYNEFVDKYEVLDKDGNIYTVRERTQSNNTEAQ